MILNNIIKRISNIKINNYYNYIRIILYYSFKLEME